MTQFLTALPSEIVQRIVHYLDQPDVVQCQCVCRSWYKTWIQFIYATVHIRGKAQFQSFFYDTLHTSLMDASYSTGYHIRRLVIESGHIEPSVLGQLPPLCPFLEVFKFDGVVLGQEARRESFQYYQQRRNREELDKVRHNFALWKHMRELVELNGITVAHALLQQPATQLTSLSVQFNNQNDRTNSKLSLIQSLHHAPHLQSLAMERIYLTVEELELIHDSCPELVSLHLLNTVLLPMSTTAVQEGQPHIRPAVDVRRFQFINGSFCDDVPRWLNYIAKKYIHARRLEIGSCSFFAGAREQEEDEDCHAQLDNTVYEPQLLQIAKLCSKLHTFKMQSFCLPAPFFQILDQQATFLNELTLGDGLTNSLALELKGLLKSQQRHSIKTLTVLAWPLAIDIRGSHALMSSLGQCTHITTLNLSLGRHFHQNDIMPASSSSTASIDNATMYLDVVLAQCPQLTHLSISDAKLACTNAMLLPAAHTSSHRYTLASLRLDNVLIDSGSDVFCTIAVHCPHLVDLYLISTIASPVYHNTRNFNIYLPQHQLKTLVLDRIRVSRKCSVRLGTSRFKIIQDTRVIWYDLISYECCTSRPLSRHVSEEYSSSSNNMSLERMRARKVKKIQDADVCYSSLDQSVYVSVVCKSIESLHLTGLCIK
ncbi:hypothetical protein FB192DRAFT_1471474 [Mucor lusitanicus]|uniref:F-box domain-containing protein n=2 Tax=Mucor circinelloides f. lusitanicus TaxID=29924 RepID=A0A168PGV0_MUCCL|nr:hypothetical protein FB192DRAFT_1471474 [Mucor lusitanicus]OAD07715.1 hypothetical protein MUCCIDRAFT_157978 [Mucor lusitanicus CBS 277.49]